MNIREIRKRNRARREREKLGLSKHAVIDPPIQEMLPTGEDEAEGKKVEGNKVTKPATSVKKTTKSKP